MDQHRPKTSSGRCEPFGHFPDIRRKPWSQILEAHRGQRAPAFRGSHADQRYARQPGRRPWRLERQNFLAQVTDVIEVGEDGAGDQPYRHDENKQRPAIMTTTAIPRLLPA